MRTRRRGVGGLLAVWTLVGGALVGCGDSDRGRVFVEIAYDTAFVFGGVEDTVLTRMEWLRSFEDGVVALDPSTGRIVYLDEGGAPRWVFHRQGEGPGEILRPWDATPSGRGTLYVLDATNAKLVELSAKGRVVREARLPPLRRNPWGVVVLGPDEVRLMEPRGSGYRWRPWEGGAERMPPLEYPDTMPDRILTQVSISPAGPSGAWAAGMIFGPRWWLASPSGEITAHDFPHRPGYREVGEWVELGDGRRVAMPPPQKSWYGSKAMTLDEDGVWSLSGGGIGVEEEPPGSILDVFDETTGAYRYSWRLPEPSLRFAKSGRRLYLLYEDPAPMIMALDLHLEGVAPSDGGAP